MSRQTLPRKKPRPKPGPWKNREDLEAKFQSELELPRVESRGRRTGVLVLDVHVSDVGFVDQVEHIHNALEIQPLVQMEVAGDAEIGEGGVRPSGGVPSQVAVERTVEDAINSSIEETRRLQEAGGREAGSRSRQAARRDGRSRLRRGDHIGPVGVGRRIEVSVGADQDVERTAGAKFDDRRHRPVGA